MTKPFKNGIPWTNLYKFPQPVDKELLNELYSIWLNEDWGANYENNRRIPIQKSIYPHTRTVPWYPKMGSKNKEFEKINPVLCEHLKQLFSIPMTVLFTELVLLVPKGQVSWHYDRMTVSALSTRILLPLTDNGDDIRYYFANWADSAPTNSTSFSVEPHIDKSSIHYCTMELGNYYAINNRVPHSTISQSDKPRGSLQIEIIPTELYENLKLVEDRPVKDCEQEWCHVFSPVSIDEKIPIDIIV